MISPAQPWRVAVVGATGYAGAELVRFLVGHPMIRLVSVISRTRAGTSLAEVHPGMEGFTNLRFETFDASRLAKLDVIFLAVPHGTAKELVEQLEEAGAKTIIDLSSDHRHAPGWVYGQAEWNQEQLRGARRIAVPGCFATAISLAIAPFVDARQLEGPVPCVAATGSTGAGATPVTATHHPERMVNLKAYKVLTHQHTPEVETFLRSLGGFEHLHFVPLSTPLDRGILATVFVRLRDPEVDAFELVQEAYDDHAFVRVRNDPPQVRHLRGTALCDLSVHRDGDVVVVLSAIDNLGKGAACQAVQCMNLAIGMAPNTGLHLMPCLP
ncbi:MAG: N-acetyl-gamma-glutamyl-phosphate reductase [Proteobacteria bacterium]|nr:N-acetyl-gamma-glutamyl-phosphate reductase [Pseudomonadota bacterium]